MDRVPPNNVAATAQGVARAGSIQPPKTDSKALATSRISAPISAWKSGDLPGGKGVVVARGFSAGRGFGSEADEERSGAWDAAKTLGSGSGTGPTSTGDAAVVAARFGIEIEAAASVAVRETGLPASAAGPPPPVADAGESGEGDAGGAAEMMRAGRA